MSDEIQEFNNDNDNEIKLEILEDELLIQEELNSENFDEDVNDVDIDVDEESNIDNTVNNDESESDLDVYFKYSTNNHKLEGKHSLKRDTIFNGKIADADFEDSYHIDFGIHESDIYEFGDIPIERGSIFEEESRHNDDILNRRRLSEDVYNLLKNNTELDFSANRRKPNKVIFNNYYKMLLTNMDKQYSKSEIFVELSYYFTDNIFNMYKLLDKNFATSIIIELKEKGHLNNLDNINFM